MIIYTPPLTPTTIPVIDLHGASRDSVVRADIFRQVHRAAREMGFFYVSNHGVPEEIRQGALEASRRFMTATDAVKHSVDGGKSLRGYEAPGRQMLDLGSPPDLKESFQFDRDSEAQEPSGNRWPAEVPEMRAPLVAYMRQVQTLGHYLMECLAGSLDLAPDYFDDGLEAPSCSVRALRYTPMPPDAHCNQLGAGAHTDWGAITILLQDDVGGLEVQNPDGNWISATPIPGCFVVNLGDMVRRWTDDLYRSTRHRVQNNNTSRDRYSIACFYGPNETYRVSRVPSCLDAAEPRYAECTVGEHFREMVRLTYGVDA